tara:strand:- start:752 stop:2746 length:1995 start_codon:yes stop_codon:yes gene_type:complete
MHHHIISNPRTASTYLTFVLRKYGYIRFNESFRNVDDFDRLPNQAQVKAEWKENIDTLRGLTVPMTSKNHVFQLTQVDKAGLLDDFKSIDFSSTIGLVRQNLFEQALSLSISTATDIWIRLKNATYNDTPIIIKLVDFDKQLRFCISELNAMFQNDLGFVYNDVIVYEDLSFDETDLALLGLDPTISNWNMPYNKSLDKNQHVININELKEYYAEFVNASNMQDLDVRLIIPQFLTTQSFALNLTPNFSVIEFLTRKNASPKKITESTLAYCPYFWYQFHSDITGEVRPCCQSNYKSPSYGNIHVDSPVKIWNDNMKPDREKILAEQKITACSPCYNDEANKLVSPRMIAIQQDHIRVADALVKKQLSNPKMIDIRFSNLCNMKCRSCGSHSSTQWISDEIKLGYDNVAEFNNHGTDLLFDDLPEFIKDATMLYFAGGEPLIMTDHYKTLDIALNLNRPDIKLRYNTNMLRLGIKDYNIVDYWNKFTTVVVTASLDASHERARFMRTGTVWDKIITNMKTIKTECPHVSLRVAPTYQICNMFHMTTMLKELIQADLVDPTVIFINNLYVPLHFSIRNLPTVIKKQIEENLIEFKEWLEGNYDAVNNTTESIAETIKFMYSGETDDQKIIEFFKHSDDLDNLRNESILDTFPELQELYEYIKDQL